MRWNKYNTVLLLLLLLGFTVNVQSGAELATGANVLRFDRTPAVTLARSLLNSFQQRRRHCANTSTPLLPDDVPETDADPQSLDGLCGGRRR